MSESKKLIFNKTLLGNELIGVTNGFLTLKEVKNSVVDILVRKYHYSHKPTKNRFFSMIVNNEDGFVQLGYGIRPTLKKHICSLIEKGNFCEFDRMWLSDKLPKNSESQVISLLLTYIKNKYPKIKFIITYADGSVGNTGIIYKASNAIYIDKIKVDFYLLPTGERIHPVSMYHRHKSRAKNVLEKIYPGIIHIHNEFQYRYLYILNKGKRKKFQERNALLPVMRGRGSSDFPLHKRIEPELTKGVKC